MIILPSLSQERAKESEEAAANARRYAPEEECTIRTNSSPDAKGAAAATAASATATASGRQVGRFSDL